MARQAKISRKTKETDISLTLTLDGRGQVEASTGVGFFDHMLTAMAFHGGFDLALSARGDLEVDAHHTVEDVGLVLGECLLKALGDKRGIARYGTGAVPMEDALAQVTVDLSGRPHCVYHADYRTERIGDFDVECLEELLRSIANTGKFNLHVNVPYGTNSHHIAEAIFKALGQALAQAVRIVRDDIPSTKGTL